jgi:RecB family exonuclease
VYDEGWRSGPHALSALGHSLHNALAAYLDASNSDQTLERLHEIFDEVWVNEGFSTPEETFKNYEEGRSMLDRFYEIDKNRTSTVVFTEKNFNFEWEGIQIQGTLDRIDRAADGTYEIIEYKTRGEKWTPERIKADKQMTFYAWGAAQGLGLKPLRLKYYFLSNGETAATERTEAVIDDLKVLIRTAAGQIQNKNYTPNPAHCPYCEIGRRCAYFKEKK